jgi:transcriptional regulator with XRE-family HTH domain
MAEEGVSKERLEAIKAAIPPEVYRALIKEAEGERRKRYPRSVPRQDIISGKRKRHQAPKSSADDRRFVPAALLHWRTVHGLTQQEAQLRIGYSEFSTAWSAWERGWTAPSFEVLLRIIAATGLGHWVEDQHADIDPSLRLEAMERTEAERKKRREHKRQTRDS